MNFRSFKRFFGGGVKQIQRRSLAGRPSKARLQLEPLEERSMMSVLPAPIVSDLATLDNFDSTRPVFGPTLVMDPVNPNTLVEVHSWIGTQVGVLPTQGQIWGNISLDRGTTWAGTGGVFLRSANCCSSTMRWPLAN